jgi:UDP-N-acetylglucosamine:LPS N-acetylglucosamine transferase
MPKPEPRVLAIASGGGHWVQLLRMRPAWEGLEVAYATVYAHSQSDVPGHRFYTFSDASRSNPKNFLVVVGQILRILRDYRPTMIVTTGSAPALIAVLAGRILGARTLWIDSIANSEELSTSGRIASRIAHSCFTQWPDLAHEGGPLFKGSVL